MTVYLRTVQLNTLKPDNLATLLMLLYSFFSYSVL